MKNFFICIGSIVLMLFIAFVGELIFDIFLSASGNRDAKLQNGKFIVRYKYNIPILLFIFGMLFAIGFIVPSFLANVGFSVKITLLSFGIAFLIATMLSVYATTHRRIMVSQDYIIVYYVLHLSKKIFYNQIVSAEYNVNILQLKLFFDSGLRFFADDDMVGVKQLYELILAKRPDICLDNDENNTITIDLDELLKK